MGCLGEDHENARTCDTCLSEDGATTLRLLVLEATNIQVDGPAPQLTDILRQGGVGADFGGDWG